MYHATTDLYDLIYGSFKDYPAEAARLAELIRAHNSGARTVLDVACGTAEHARLLTADHALHVDGLDLEPGFVRIAREKLPGAKVHEADMAAFDLPDRYDVVLCLFSSIGYLRSIDRVREALGCFHAHLAPGGIVIVEPWFPPGFLTDGRVGCTTVQGEGVHVARMNHIRTAGRMSFCTFEYLIGRPEGIEHAVEVHELALYTQAEMLEAFAAAGLRAEYDPVGPAGRGLYIAVAA